MLLERCEDDGDDESYYEAILDAEEKRKEYVEARREFKRALQRVRHIESNARARKIRAERIMAGIPSGTLAVWVPTRVSVGSSAGANAGRFPRYAD